jgi:hypothetical protein
MDGKAEKPLSATGSKHFLGFAIHGNTEEASLQGLRDPQRSVSVKCEPIRPAGPGHHTSYLTVGTDVRHATAI